MQLFDYLQVPPNFGVCNSVDCPKVSTCLRRIALKHAPAGSSFQYISNPNEQIPLGTEYTCYCPSTKVRYAKGFSNLTDSLSVHVTKTFRWRLILQFGRAKYCQLRRGEVLITPSEQEYIVRQAKHLGLKLDEYFDGYVDGYNWECLPECSEANLSCR